MRIPLSQLNHSTRDLLRTIQESPSAYAIYYQSESKTGKAVLGVVLVAGWLLSVLLLALYSGSAFPFLVWLFFSLFASWIAVASIRSLLNERNSTLKPAVLLTPMYLVRIGKDDLLYYDIWSERQDLKIAHTITNGVYSGTSFQFLFRDGAHVSFLARPKATADQLIARLEQLRIQMMEAARAQDFSAFAGHDIFRAEAGRTFPSTGPRGPSRWQSAAIICVAGVAVAALLHLTNFYRAQVVRLASCETKSDYLEFIEEFSPNFFLEESRQGLFESYQAEYEQNRRSATRLREMIRLKQCKSLSPEQEKRILTLYQEEGKKDLRRLYASAIDRYRNAAQADDQAAKDAIIRILEAAVDKDQYRVSVTFSGTTEQVRGPFTIQTDSGTREVVPMDPSFTPAENRAREGKINTAIRTSFSRIIPNDILQFVGGTGDIRFTVDYVVFPSNMVYHETGLSALEEVHAPYYKGIGFHWKFRILVDNKNAYEFEEESFPPAHFEVHRQETSAPSAKRPELKTAAVYDRMAETAFDDFGKRLLKRFGM